MKKTIFKITNKNIVGNKIIRSITFDNADNCYYVLMSIFDGQFYYQTKHETLKAAIEELYDDIDLKESNEYKLETPKTKAIMCSDDLEYGYLKYKNQRRRGFNSLSCALDCFIYNEVENE